AIAGADLVVASTGSFGHLVTRGVVRTAITADTPSGDARPRFFLDLGVPRDVDPTIATLPGVRVADIDDLRGALAERSHGTTTDLDRARAIVAEEQDRFAAWRRAARVAPLIRALQERGARVLAAELARVAPRLATLEARERDAVEA